MTFDPRDPLAGHQPHDLLAPHDHGHIHSRPHANRWGGRVLLSTDSAIAPRSNAVLIDTPFFDTPILWRLSSLFSSRQGPLNATPFAFTPLAVCPTRVTLRHGIDDRQGTIDDVYELAPSDPAFDGLITPCWLPVATIASRKLTVIVEATAPNPGASGPSSTTWADFSATPITAVDTDQIIASRDGTNILGFPATFSTRVPASAGFVEFAPASAARRKIYITNDGTTRLYVGLGFTPTLGGPTERWTLALDPKGGAHPFYEGALDECWGPVRGIWEGAPTGFAMFSETNIFA